MKSVFITIVGRPNVGKSTLTNKLVNEKVAIVSDKAGTTRDQIKGIVNINENQFIFVDTPGIHKPKHLLGEHMTNIAIEALENVDLIMFMLDGTKEISTGDMFVNEHIRAVNTPIVAIINKIDKMTDAEIEEKKVEIREKLGDFDEIITLTAEYGIGVHKIFDVAENYLSNDMWFYPEDYYTDLPVNKIVVETIREKILHHTKDEVQHSVAVEIINVETKPTIRKYDVNIYVERDSQKGIIIGKDGALLKKIGIEARREIEHLIDLKVNLKLWVKVKKKWRKNSKFLDEMGYSSKKNKNNKKMSTIKKLLWLSLAIQGAALLAIFLLKDARFTKIGLYTVSICAVVQMILISLTPTVNLKLGALKRELLSIAILCLIVLIMRVVACFQGRINVFDLLIEGYLTVGVALIPFGMVYLKLKVDD